MEEAAAAAQSLEHQAQSLLHTTSEHLRREESAMASMGFSDLERHKVGHDHFIAKLAELQKKYESGSVTVAAQLSTVLRDWLSLHIRRSDKELKRHLTRA